MNDFFVSVSGWSIFLIGLSGDSGFDSLRVEYESALVTFSVAVLDVIVVDFFVGDDRPVIVCGDAGRRVIRSGEELFSGDGDRCVLFFSFVKVSMRVEITTLSTDLGTCSTIGLLGVLFIGFLSGLEAGLDRIDELRTGDLRSGLLDGDVTRLFGEVRESVLSTVST